MKQTFMNGCVPGAKGVAVKSDYMNTEIFANDYLPIFIGNVHCSHMSLKAIELCKNAGIHSLTLPCHTSDKLQLPD